MSMKKASERCAMFSFGFFGFPFLFRSELNEIEANHVKSNETKWSQMKANGIMWDTMKPSETECNQIKSGKIKWNQDHLFEASDLKWNHIEPRVPSIPPTQSLMLLHLAFSVCIGVYGIGNTKHQSTFFLYIISDPWYRLHHKSAQCIFVAHWQRVFISSAEMFRAFLFHDFMGQGM